MNLESLVAAVTAAWIIENLVEKIIKPIWEHFALDKFWLAYVALIVGAALAWFTGLNAFPVFTESETVGRVLTCLVVGLGPSAIYDMWVDKPDLPE